MSEYSIALESQLFLARWSMTDRGAEGIALAFELGDDPVAARDVVQDVRALLLSGETYYWSPPISGMITEAARSMPNWTLLREHLPAPAFFWFDEPLTVPEFDAGEEAHLVALSIGQYQNAEDDAPAGLCAMSWLLINGPDVPVVAPWGAMFWRFGEARDEMLAILRDEYASDGDGITANEFVLRYLGASLAFIQQRILVSSPQPVDRAARRRIARDFDVHHAQVPLVRAIRLRRVYERGGRDEGDADVVWTCRWMVHGHWRAQWYPSLKQHQAIFVLPYVKGPEDKPLRVPAATVKAVVR